MAGKRYHFGGFTLDPDQRTLHQGDDESARPIALNSRYFDALLLLVEHPGELISKDRFNEQVWHAAPVTDEALTQCIRTLRRALHDKASDPSFIETVPRHGYRFIADVGEASGPSVLPAEKGSVAPRDATPIPVSATFGGAAAGVIGGLFYGAIALPDGSGGLSALLVLLVICTAIGAIAGLGIGTGIWAALRRSPDDSPWVIAGAAIGGAATGALVRLVGLDAFTLILGDGPQSMAGAGEGAVLGAVIGGALYLAKRASRLQPALAFAAIAGLASGAVIAFAGGRMMAGSLQMLSEAFGGAGFRLERIGALVGEDGFGTLSLAFSTAFEAMLFASCVTAAILIDPLRRKSGHEARGVGRKAATHDL